VPTDLHRELMEGRRTLPRAGGVAELPGRYPGHTVVDGAGEQVQPVTAFLKDLALGDSSPLTCRSYAYDLLRWFRMLWFLAVPWERAAEAEAAAMVGMLRSADNPQRQRWAPHAAPAGSVNLRTGKSYLSTGYAPSTINRALSVVSGFYAFHRHHGRGPLVNPVPQSEDRRQAVAHRSPLLPPAQYRRGRLRQRTRRAQPRAIPDALWEELFAAVSHVRDRAALQLYVSSGARASELLAVTLADIDWAGQRIHVTSKGTRLREAVPVSPQALLLLAAYLDEAGLPGDGEPVLRTCLGAVKPLSYWAMRRALQRANEKISTNWSLHDLRHTAAARMANDPHLTLAEVRTILRHSSLATTGVYLNVRLEALFDKLQEHYQRPRSEPRLAPGYDPQDMKAVFGG